MDRRQAARVRQDVLRLCHAGLDSKSLRSEVIRQLRRIIPIDVSFFATTDPATVLFTGAVADGILEGVTPRFLANEFGRDDVNQFSQLARDQVHVRSLSQATGGKIERSHRYRDILSSLALGDELRAALVVDGGCWGVICLHRERSQTTFTSAEAAYLARLAPHLAEGLRTALLVGAIDAVPTPEGPGVALLAEDLSLRAATPAAERWLAEMTRRDWPRGGRLPGPVATVASHLQMLERGESLDVMPRVRLRTAEGCWLVLHASRLMGPEQRGQIAVMIEEAHPAEIAPLIVQSYGLSPRESEIAGLILRGLSTTEIARELVITPLTVQDHLKSIFEKVGVRSRRELVAQIFERQYRRPMMAGAVPDATGRLRKQQSTG